MGAVIRAGNAREQIYSAFGGGVVFDADRDPGELDIDQASDILNVDLDSESIRKRKGKAKYNSSVVGTGGCLGGHVIYPRDPTVGRKMLLAAVASPNPLLYLDADGNGSFETNIATLAAAADHCDLFQYRDTVYIGDGIDPLKKTVEGAASSTVALMTGPGAFPVRRVTPITLQVEDFESAAANWVESGGTSPGNIQVVLDTGGDANVKEGVGALRLEVIGSGVSGTVYTRTLATSGGSNKDLSKAEELRVWVYGTHLKPVFQIAVSNDSGVFDWASAPLHTVTQRRAWFPIKIPLGHIPPDDRAAVTKIAIRYVNNGGVPASAGNSPQISFDDMRAVGPFPTDTYFYRYTYAITDGLGNVIQESNPTTWDETTQASGVITVDRLANPVLGIRVQPTGSGNSGATRKVRIWRKRKNGFHSDFRLVGTIADGAGTLTFDDYVGEGELLRTNAESLPLYDKVAPPLADTYALVNHRMIAGNVVLSAVRHPWRLYISRFLFPEEFSSTHNPTDPTSAGWIDLPERDPIVRIVDLDGTAVIFCARSIWTLEGSGWDDFYIQKRADVGLTARHGVAIRDRIIYFLASDGLRVLVPSASTPGTMATWLISEPVNSLLEAIPARYRKDTAMGVDERGRIVCSFTAAGGTANTVALVFDPRIKDALTRESTTKRRGWTYYSNWGAAFFFNLKHGGFITGTSYDNGELMAGDPAAGTLWKMNSTEADNAVAIAWHWQSRSDGQDFKAQRQWGEMVAQLDAANGQIVTLTARVDRGRDTHAVSDTLSATAGVDHRAVRNKAISGYENQIKIDGSQSVAIRVRKLGYHYWIRP